MRAATLVVYSCCCLLDIATAGTLSKHVDILNQSGGNLEVYWIDPSSNAQVPFSDVYNGTQLKVASYINHTFVVRQTKAETKESRTGYVTVTEDDTQVVYVKENMEVLHTTPEEPSESITGNVLSSLSKECLKKQGKKISNSSANKTMDSLFSCYEEELAKLLAENNEEISFQDKTRKHVASLLENYTCSDEGLPTTQTTHVKKWTYHDTIHDVHLLHERPESQIHLVKNFITQDECDAFQDAASRVLHRGTVANGNGGSRLSDNRKAWQAGIRVPWEKEAGGDHIAQYTRRMYAYANKATGYGMEVVGQEDIMSIQYFGKNGDHPQGSSYTPATPDRYMPHCDGDCAGLQHKPGSRVATMVAYCTVPARGGATNFQNAGIHVKPEKGSAAFFSYMNADTHDMDTGWTTHSGCPVVEGTKRIVVHWMRVGVSADEPWDSFNTLNIPKRFVEDCE